MQAAAVCAEQAQALEGVVLMVSGTPETTTQYHELCLASPHERSLTPEGPQRMLFDGDGRARIVEGISIRAQAAASCSKPVIERECC